MAGIPLLRRPRTSVAVLAVVATALMFSSSRIIQIGAQQETQPPPTHAVAPIPSNGDATRPPHTPPAAQLAGTTFPATQPARVVPQLSRAETDALERLPQESFSFAEVCESTLGTVELDRRSWFDHSDKDKEAAAGKVAFTDINGSLPAYSCRCLGGYRSGQDHWKTFFYWAMTWLCAGVNGPTNPSPRRLRVVQVGANSGDNANDPLFELLRRHNGILARSALLEPVPWVFSALVRTYTGGAGAVAPIATNLAPTALKRTPHMYRKERIGVDLVGAGVVVPMQNAMDKWEGNLSFMAPKPETESLGSKSASSIKNWMAQVGGIHIAKKVEKHVSKHKLASFLERIEVRAVRLETVLRRMNWISSGAATPNLLPDIFVVDSEGHDDVIIDVVLEDIRTHYGPDARIPLLLYEFKHFSEEKHFALLRRLAGLGYCLSVVGEDVVGVHFTVERLKQECSRVNL